MKKRTTFFFTFCFSCFLAAQCPFDPTVEGNLILCPNSTEILSTQEYDTYQWYRRGFNDPDALPIPGDTLQSITVNTFDDALFYFSVEATLDGCTELSPEVLLDAWAFLPVVVQSGGDFTIGMNGESIVCIGDTMYFTINQPYDTNITWFKDGAPIQGETSTVLAVTEPGQYTVSGAPSVCPDYVQSLGLILEVVFIECSTGSEETILPDELISVFPNPATSHITIACESIINPTVLIYNNVGQLVDTQQISGSASQLDVSEYPPGIYFLYVKNGNFTIVKRLSIITLSR